jgi:hypothetical protein
VIMRCAPSCEPRPASVRRYCTVETAPRSTEKGAPEIACAHGAGRGSETVQKEREREERKLDPKRQDLVRRISRDHPEWGPKEIEELHRELDDWGE